MSKTKNTVKTGISIDSNLLARCDASIPLTNAQSRSEFISDAIEYYIASLNRTLSRQWSLQEVLRASQE